MSGVSAADFESLRALGLSLLVAGGMAFAFLAMLRARVGGIGFFLLGLAPNVAVELLNPIDRTVSYHGFWHVSILYGILQDGVPPEDRLFAGRPLLYPWGYQWMAAALVRTLGVSPGWAFAAVNLLGLALSMVSIHFVAVRFVDDRRDARLATLLALFGLGISSAFYLNDLARRHLGLFLEFRGLPPVSYFTTINGTAAGLACYSLVLAGILALGSAPSALLRSLAMVGAGIAGTGFFYPFHFLSAVAVATLASAAGSLAAGGWSRRDAAATAGTAAFAAALVAPYILGLTAPKADAARLHLSNPSYMIAKMNQLLFLLVPLAVVTLVERKAVLAAWRARPAAGRALLVAAIVPISLYLGVTAPLSNEYKFMTLAVLSLGILAAPALGALLRRRTAVGFLVLAAFLTPLGSILVFKTTWEEWRVSDPFVEDGRTIRHADPDAEAIYAWIREASPPDAVFVDSYRTVPVFGQRALYVALDLRRRQPLVQDGWGFPADWILKLNYGHPPADVDRRSALARDLCCGSGALPADDRLDAFKIDVGARPVFVVARQQGNRARLESDRRFLRVVASRDAAVYRLRPRATEDESR
jgi:hypothetical protein